MCLAVERGLKVCAPVHDALLVECPKDSLEDARGLLRTCMVEASAKVLGTGELRVGVDRPVIWPDRYHDARGKHMWQRITDLLAEVDVR